MIIIDLMGGFGNWMFQIAFCEYLKQLTNCQVKTYITIYSPHASTDLMSGVFQNWKECLTDNNIPHHFNEENLLPYDWKDIVSKYSSIRITGYFQNYNYIRPSFLEKLILSNESIKKYPDINNRVFIHIRGGDYIGNWTHDIDLFTNYYPNAIKEFPEGTKFYVFTNDIEYAKTKLFLNGISYEFIQESEVDSMYLMSQCKGGICANSSFSWWGAYLNKNRKLILPSKWFNNTSFYTKGYYFPEATVIDV
jgi:hypothetical protein